MQKDQSSRRKGIIAELVAQVLFGLSFLFTKEATREVTPLELLSWRFTIAAIVFLILIKAGFFKVSFRGKNIRMLLVLGILHPIIYFLCENKGIALTSAAESGLIIASMPIFCMLFSMLFLKTRSNRTQALGIVITIIGVCILVAGQSTSPTFNLLGYVLLFSCVIAYCLFAILNVKIPEFTSVEKAAAMVFSGAVFFTVTNLIIEAVSGNVKTFLRLPLDNRSLLIAALYLGIGSTIIAFTCNNIGIETLGTTASASFVGISTIVTVLAGAIFLHEELTITKIISTVLVITGVFIANKSQPETQSE